MKRGDPVLETAYYLAVGRRGETRVVLVQGQSVEQTDPVAIVSRRSTPVTRQAREGRLGQDPPGPSAAGSPEARVIAGARLHGGHLGSQPHARRALVVDDERPIRELLQEVLTRWGYVADVAPDGTVALGRLSEGRYDLLVTDLGMPGVSGWQVMEAARTQAPAVAVVVMTGSATRDDCDRARKRGVTLVRKPFQLHELRAAIRECQGGVPE